MRESETIIFTDQLGFLYRVTVEFKPHHGFATAYYYGSIIAQVELNKIHTPHPVSDSDAEWECYEERYNEWKDEIKVNMYRIFSEYFNPRHGNAG